MVAFTAQKMGPTPLKANCVLDDFKRSDGRSDGRTDDRTAEKRAQRANHKQPSRGAYRPCGKDCNKAGVIIRITPMLKILDGLYQHTLKATGRRPRPVEATFLGHMLGTKPAKNMRV